MVEDNMKSFSKRQIEGAEKACSLYAGLAYPSLTDYKWILKSNQIQECPVSYEDADVAEKIWGPNKTVFFKPAVGCFGGRQKRTKSPIFVVLFLVH